MSAHWRIALLIGVACLLILGTLALPPFPQPLSYHDFADQESLLGIPYAGDVLSNLAFIGVGLLGLWWVWGHRDRFLAAHHRWPYLIFFGAIILVGIGSSYYHWSPDNPRLYWDRLPMSLAFMSILASILAERASPRLASVALVLLLVLGAGGATHWIWSEWQGEGDLRFYLLTQLLPLVLGLWLVLSWPSPYSHERDLLLGVGWYGLAVVAEKLDHQIDALSGGWLSGHTLKHLLAAVAIYWVLRMLRSRSAKGGLGFDHGLGH
jgi:hypothetical protein